MWSGAFVSSDNLVGNGHKFWCQFMFPFAVLKIANKSPHAWIWRTGCPTGSKSGKENHSIRSWSWCECFCHPAVSPRQCSFDVNFARNVTSVSDRIVLSPFYLSQWTIIYSLVVAFEGKSLADSNESQPPTIVLNFWQKKRKTRSEKNTEVATLAHRVVNNFSSGYVYIFYIYIRFSLPCVTQMETFCSKFLGFILGLYWVKTSAGNIGVWTPQIRSVILWKVCVCERRREWFVYMVAPFVFSKLHREKAVNFLLKFFFFCEQKISDRREQNWQFNWAKLLGLKLRVGRRGLLRWELNPTISENVSD